MNGFQPQSQGMNKPEGKWDQYLTKPLFAVVCYTLVLMIAMEFVGLNEKLFIFDAILIGWVIVVWNNIMLYIWFLIAYMVCLFRLSLWFLDDKKNHPTEPNENFIMNLVFGVGAAFLILTFRRVQLTISGRKTEDKFFDEVLKHPGPYEKMRRNVSIIFASKIINIDQRDQSRREIVKDMAIIMSGFHTPYFFEIDNQLHRIRRRGGDDTVKVVDLSQEAQNVIQYRDKNLGFLQPSMV